MRWLAVVGFGLALATGSGWRTFHGDGIAVRYPRSWHATLRPLTPVTAPGQLLAVASYRLPTTDRGADGCEPKQALDEMPSDGALIYGWGDGNPPPGPRAREFRTKPARFAFGHRVRDGCLGPSYVFLFRLQGRYFQFYAVLGPTASRSTRATVLRILDSFQLAPG